MTFYGGRRTLSLILITLLSVFAVGCQTQDQQSPDLTVTKIGQQINVYAEGGEKPANATESAGWARIDQRMGNGSWESSTDTSAGDAKGGEQGAEGSAELDVTP